MAPAAHPRRLVLALPLLPLLPLLLPAAAARAQSPTWPERPVRLVVPYAPGGPTDILARALAERLHAAWGQPVVVENRPGAGSAIGTEYVARQPADGHVLLVAASAHVMNPPLMPRLPFDPLRDFTPIINMAFHPMVLVVHPSLPVRTVAEFVAAGRARPGGFGMANAGVGTATHLAAALFAQAAGMEVTHVPFGGAAPAQTAILSGQVPAGFLNSTVAVPQIRAGALRGLAVAAAGRWRELPELPTLPELGFSGMEATSWYGLLAPAGLPEALRQRLFRDVRDALRQPAVRERVRAAGLDPLEVGPEAFGAQLAAELEKWARLVRAAGIRVE